MEALERIDDGSHSVGARGEIEGLAERIAEGRFTTGVIGLGYVGLPLSCAIAETGHSVIGFDTDGRKVESLRRGESYLRHIPSSRIAEAIRERPTNGDAGATTRLDVTADFSALAACDVVVICVPTPLTEGREPDLRHVTQTVEVLGEALRPGQLVILESTTYPGTTDEVVRDLLETPGLRVGRDFCLAYSPEREDPGNRTHSTTTIPKLVGGVTPDCGRIAAMFYGRFIDDVVLVRDARTAEAAKLLENIFRSVNIALVNELKMLFDRMDIDVWSVIEASATKPFGFMPFYPGPGLGGHCIPIDPFYLTWKARQYDFSTRFIELAGEINTAMPYYVVERLTDALARRYVPIAGARILVLGVGYKKDVDDLRESPALKLIQLLESRGARVEYSDPYIPTLRTRRLRGYDTFQLDSVPLSEAALAAFDGVVIATDHSEFDWDFVVKNARLVVDTRNATAGLEHVDGRVVKA